MKLETLMIKAIREFKKANPKAEIRSCYVAGGFGSWQKWRDAEFHIEYVLERGGEYQSTDIHVAANDATAITSAVAEMILLTFILMPPFTSL